MNKTTNRPRAADLRTEINALLETPDPNCNISISFRSAMIDIFNDDPIDHDAISHETIAELAAITRLIELLRTLNANLTYRLCDIYPDMPDATESYPNCEMIELRTELALADSLCPMHFIDYAICFDDETPECAAIRSIHPSHDT
jgi:hypothetical protein